MPEVNPEDDPIEEIFLDDKPVPLEDFRQEIKSQVEKVDGLLPPDLSRSLNKFRGFVGKPIDLPWLDLIPDEDRNGILDFYKTAEGLGEFYIRIFGQFQSGIADMLYIYLLTGETQEMPGDWISRVSYIPPSGNYGEPMISIMASQVANPEIVVQEFRREFSKRFGTHHPKVTPAMVSTAYFMQLQRLGKPWNFIVEQFIERNKIQLPIQRNSQRYAEIWRRCENKLRKRMQRCEKVLSVLLEDKK